MGELSAVAPVGFHARIRRVVFEINGVKIIKLAAMAVVEVRLQPTVDDVVTVQLGTVRVENTLAAKFVEVTEHSLTLVMAVPV